MAYVTASNRNTGDLITSGIWNQDAVDNPNFLKGLAGPVDIADDLNPTDDAFSGTPQDLGIGGDPATAKRWQDIFGVRLHANRYRADLGRRTVILTWENLDIGAADAFADHQMVKTVVGGGDVVEAGLGQIVLVLGTGATDEARIDQRRETIAPVGVALDNRFAGSRFPYIRFEMSHVAPDPQHRFFIGLRDTPAFGIPGVAESHIGFRMVNPANNFEAVVGDGSSVSSLPASPFSSNVRTIYEIAILSASLVDFYVDGAFGGTFTSSIPTALMELSLNVQNVLAPAFGFSLTMGMAVVQEDRV